MTEDPITPPLEQLLRRAATSYQLAPSQDARIRHRVFEDAAQPVAHATDPGHIAEGPRVPLAQAPEQVRNVAPPPRRIPQRWRPWFEMAVGMVAIAAVAIVLVLVLHDEPGSSSQH